MMLVDRAVIISATRIRQVATNRALEEAFASLARRHSVMFAGTFVTAYNALEATAAGLWLAILSVRRGRLYVHGRRCAETYPVCGAERWRTDAIVVVIVVVVDGGSCVGRARYAWTRSGRTHKPARATVHARPSAGHLR